MADVQPPIHVAVVGGGITGCCAASVLCSSSSLRVDLFDQGRSGVGGRSSTRRIPENGHDMQWDHGCQVCTRVDTWSPS